MNRVILHCDCNSFFASVECFFNPKLKNLPMAVCGDPENRHGIVLAKNELAKQYGVKTAETISQAKEKCPNLVLAKSHYKAYREFSRKVNEIYLKYTNLVEPFGIDESWLDVTDSVKVFGSGYEIAERIRKEVKKEIGISVSIGVSFNKVFAKLGSDYKKPDAVTVIDKNNFKDIIFPLNVDSLLYVGKRSSDTLKEMGIRTIGELANFNKNILSRKLGKMGVLLYEYANGLDDSPVIRWGEQEEIKSVGNGLTFKRDLSGENDIKTAVTSLCDTVCERMRRYGVKCTTVAVQVKNPDFKTVSKQCGLLFPSNTSGEIREKALELIKDVWGFKAPVRSITITGSNLVDDDGNEQISLFNFENDVQRQNDIDKTMDKIREKYGHSSIKFASIINNDLGISRNDRRETEEEE